MSNLTMNALASSRTAVAVVRPRQSRCAARETAVQDTRCQIERSRGSGALREDEEYESCVMRLTDVFTVLRSVRQGGSMASAGNDLGGVR